MFASTLPLLPLVLDDVPWALRQMLVQEGLPHIERDRRNALGRFLLFDSRNGPLRRPRAGQIAIDVELLRAAFDEDPFREWSDHRTQRFEWQVGPLRPSEEIARVDKRALRRGVMARLQEELERRGGVWIGLAPYPFPHRSAFNWRIDYDEFDERDFARLQSALSARADAVSHFVKARPMKGGSTGYGSLRDRMSAATATGTTPTGRTKRTCGTSSAGSGCSKRLGCGPPGSRPPEAGSTNRC